MRTAPRAAKRSAATDLPAAIPPVSPMRCIAPSCRAGAQDRTSPIARSPAAKLPPVVDEDPDTGSALDAGDDEGQGPPGLGGECGEDDPAERDDRSGDGGGPESAGRGVAAAHDVTVPERPGPAQAFRHRARVRQRTVCPVARRWSLTCPTVSCPKWKTLAARTASAPASAAAAKCSTVPAPPEAMSGMRTS